MRDYLLYCGDCNEYTALGRFLPQEGRFEGEYSLLYNRRMHSDDLLGRFLVRHANHALQCCPAHTEQYSRVLVSAARFMEDDIDALFGERMERHSRQADELRLERGLGQLQLNVLDQMLQEETESIARHPSRSSAEGQFMLGKEEGLKLAHSLLRELMEKTNSLYR